MLENKMLPKYKNTRFRENYNAPIITELTKRDPGFPSDADSRLTHINIFDAPEGR